MHGMCQPGKIKVNKYQWHGTMISYNPAYREKYKEHIILLEILYRCSQLEQHIFLFDNHLAASKFLKLYQLNIYCHWLSNVLSLEIEPMQYYSPYTWCLLDANR